MEKKPEKRVIEKRAEVLLIVGLTSEKTVLCVRIKKED